MSRHAGRLMVLAAAAIASTAGVARAVDISGTVREAGTGAPLDGWLVSAEGGAAEAAVVGADGRFVVTGAPTATTPLEVRSSTGVLFGRFTPAGGAADLQVAPSGHVYVTGSGAAARGARVRLLDQAGVPVADDVVGAGQQGQEVDKHGLYRFDIGAPGAYQLEVLVDGQALHFPSRLVPPQSGPAVFDAQTGLIAAPAAPDPRAPGPYWLQFRLPDGLQVAPRHNHLAVDAGEALVVIQKSASKGQVATGDVVTWTLRIENRSATDYVRVGGRGGVVVRDILPSQMRLVDTSVRGFLNGAPVTLAPQSDAQLLTFQRSTPQGPVALELEQGSLLVVRYQTVIGVNARPGQTLTNRAQVVEPGGVPLSGEVGVDVRVVGDPLFDESWVRGRVYCDLDGDGWAGPRDPGVYGARVYIDTGRYAVTDRDGKFHLTAVPPGLRMLKVDPDTVPPDSEPVTRISRTLHVTRGMPQQVSFGFRCATTAVGPTTVEPAGSDTPPSRTPRVVFTGSLSDLGLTVDGADTGSGVAAIAIDGAPARGVFDAPWSPAGLARPVTFKLTPAGTPTTWRVWIERRERRGGSTPVRVWVGAGAPPDSVVWDGRDAAGAVIAERATAYLARLEVADGRGGRWRSAPVQLTVGAQQGGPAVSETFTEPLDGRGRLSAAMRRSLRDLARRLNALSDAAVIVRVGVGPAGDRAVGTATADALREALVEQGVPSERITTELSVDSTEVDIQAFDGTPSGPTFRPPPMPAAPASVEVAGRTVVPDGQGRFVAAPPVPGDGLVPVELRQEGGATRELLLRWGDSAPGAGPSVRAELAEGKLAVAGAEVDLAGLDLRVRLNQESLGIAGGAPEQPLVFNLHAPVPDVATWSVTVLGPAGQEVFKREGQGRPPPTVPWSDAAGLEAGDYIYGAQVTTAAGATALSPRRVLVLQDGLTGAGTGQLIETFRGKLFEDDNRLRRPFLDQLAAAARELRKRPASERYLIEAHADGAGDAAAAEQLTRVRAERVKNVLMLRGLPAERLTTAGLGNQRPLEQGASPRAKRQNERIEIRLLPEEPRDGPPTDTWRLTVADKEVTVSSGGRGMASLEPPKEGEPIEVVVRGRYGQRLVTRVAPPPTPEEPTSAPEAGKTPFGIHTLGRALERHKRRDGPPPPLAVAALSVELPPDGSELGQPLLPIQGSVPPDANIKVAVNGQTVPLDDGRFDLLLPLPNGEQSAVVIEAVDPDGNRARVERTYKVKGNALFVMAIAEGMVSQHTTRLDQHTSTLDVGPVLLHGRVALYLKARIKGNDLIEQIKITGYADTARDPAFQNFVDQLIDPERMYPIYGDSAEEVIDAKTRGRYFAAIEADESKLLVGSFVAGEWGIELFRYDRVMEGVQVHLQETWVPGYETVVDGFASFNDDRVRRGHATLRGTGGSLYFLPDREIIEGSELVKLAVYDRDSGARLTTIAQSRDLDYRIDYVSGRITFKKPVPSHADAGFLVGSADMLGSNMLFDGHEIRVLVDYETRTARDVSDTTWGAYAKQELGGVVTVGGGYLREGRAEGTGPDYELYGAEVHVTPTRTTRIAAELAHSQSSNGAHFASDDGGLSFRALGQMPQETEEGWGLTVRAETDVGEFLGKDEPFLHLRANYQRVDEGFISADTVYQQGQERGGGQVDWHIDRGQRLVLRHDTLRALRQDLGFVEGSREVSRSLTSALYQHRLGRWTLAGEVLHAYETDEERPEATNRGALGVLARYQVTPRLGLFVEQEFFLGGEAPVFEDTLDHFATSVGLDVRITHDLSLTLAERVVWSGEDATMIGLRTQLSETTSLYVQQRLVHPRDSSRWIPATVVGSEEQWGNGGRSYGEYQLGTSASGSFNRAVLGVARRFDLLPGFHADIAFERSHTDVMDALGTTRDANSLSVGAEYLAHSRFKLSSRLEVRYETSDHDRLQIATFNRLTAELGKGFSLMGKVDLSTTQNQDLDKREAETMELSLGLAYRPLHERFSLLVKAARLVDMRPVGLDPEGGSLRVTADVVAVEPIIELPLRLQFTPKVAYRHAVEEAEGLPSVETHTFLAALRLAVHVWETLDVAGEYRFISVDLIDELEHGALVEAAVNITRFARIGAGYNFTNFTDDVFDPLARNDHGFFVRISGMY